MLTILDMIAEEFGSIMNSTLCVVLGEIQEIQLH